jgi:hypothetical protein
MMRGFQLDPVAYGRGDMHWKTQAKDDEQRKTGAGPPVGPPGAVRRLPGETAERRTLHMCV